MDPYNYAELLVIPMIAYDKCDAAERLRRRTNPDAWGDGTDEIDLCYRDEPIPTRARNRAPQMVRSLT